MAMADIRGSVCGECHREHALAFDPRIGRRKTVRPGRARGTGAFSSVFVLSLVLVVYLFASGVDSQAADQMCYNSDGSPSRCIPAEAARPLINAEEWSTNSSCAPSEVFCELNSGAVMCQNCSSQFAVGFLTDLSAISVPTFWQSALLPSTSSNVILSFSGYTNMHLVHSLLMSFDKPPRSVFMEKSIDGGSTWTAIAYFAVDCMSTYGIMPNADVSSAPGTPRCEPLDPSQTVLTFQSSTGRVVGQQDTHDHLIQTNEDYRRFTSANAVRIVLDDVSRPTAAEISSSGRSLDLFNYYRVSNAAIYSQLQCFGHGGASTLTGNCVCEHRTTGSDCMTCQDFFVDLPWMPATDSNPFECKECNCNQHSGQCVFNQTLFEDSLASISGPSGGHCMNCLHNTMGPHCEECVDGHYPDDNLYANNSAWCLPCNCDTRGTISNQTRCLKNWRSPVPGLNGLCLCRSLTSGMQCHQCKPNAYAYDSNVDTGCTDCQCLISGTVNGDTTCHNVTGQCGCKDNTEGLRCNTCKDGFFNLTSGNTAGCEPCACVLGYSTHNTCDAVTGQCLCRPGFTGRRCESVIPGRYVPDIDHIRLEAESLATIEYLSNGVGYYRLAASPGSVRRGPLQVPMTLSYCLYVRYNTSSAASVTVRVVGGGADDSYSAVASPTGAVVRLTTVQFTEQVSYEFIVSSNVEVLIDSIVLVPEVTQLPQFSTSGALADFTGAGCGSSGCDALSASASQLSVTCRSILSRAMAELHGMANDCACSAPGQVAGSTSCDPIGGQCSCLASHTTRTCSQCAGEYFVNGSSATGCQACSCDMIGATSPICRLGDGQCPCHSGRDGRTCDRCQTNYHHPDFTTGPCEQCMCNSTGSITQQCFDVTGGCDCKSGVTDPLCTSCRSLHWGFSDAGCTLCNCDPSGSTSRCDMFTGQCECFSLTEGMRCDQCKAGSHYLSRDNVGTGCRQCECNGHTAVCTTAVPDGAQVGVGQPNCSCPIGYAGLACEGCADGYTHNKTSGGALSTDVCVPCSCNGHTDSCDPDTGVCLRCANNTEGTYCQSCRRGYHGDATVGLATDCRKCECPLTTTDEQYDECFGDGAGGHICPKCPGGATGSHCERCADGYMGNPLAGLQCSNCSCSGNIDMLATGNCNTTTGQCLKCIANTDGFTCDRCKDHYYGEAVTAKNCTLCNCDGQGTVVSSVCNRNSGQCACRDGVYGRRCDACLPNHFGFGDALGCSACNCSMSGSSLLQCDSAGVCSCRAGAGGSKCDTCMDGFYRSPGRADVCGDTTGSPCRACCCDASNTVGGQQTCNASGVCSCKPGSQGNKCDVCSVGYFRHPVTGCQPCQCNQHSSSCTNATSCQSCGDNTEGDQCQLCLPGYYGDPTSGGTCHQCRCNGFADTCSVTAGTSSGFVCDSCSNNTRGSQCDQCSANHYRDPSPTNAGCLPCLAKCNGNSLQCDVATGECTACAFDTTGTSCQVCRDDFFGDASQRTCRACSCNTFGTVSSVPCSPADGSCTCRSNVTGHTCDQCLAFHFNLTSNNGCSPCNCGLGSTSDACHATTGACSCGPLVTGLRCDQCVSTAYNLRAAQCTACQCVRNGTEAGNDTCDSVTGQCRCEPGTTGLRCDTCLPGYYWTLSGCTPCACSDQSGTCDRITGVCSNCSGNTDGDNCETCRSEFYRSSAGACVPCGCHGNGAVDNVCHGASGQCSCRVGVDNTTRTCGVCRDDFHSLTASGCRPCNCDATGTADATFCNKTNGNCVCKRGYESQRCQDCQRRYYRFQQECVACNCDVQGSADGGADCELSTGQCSCLSNVTGRRCDRCDDVYFGFGNAAGCSACSCDAVGARWLNCSATGACDCKPGVDGSKCDVCKDEFFGLASSGCAECGCNVNGSVHPVCDKTTGRCTCHPNLDTLNDLKCTNCRSGHFVHAGGTGCVNCTCHPLGTVGSACDPAGGQCNCINDNVDGRTCGACRAMHYDFPACTACNCNMNGSFNGSCDDNGRCFCLPNALGEKCDVCAENFVLTTSGCELCASCYNITQSQVQSVRMRLATSLHTLTIIMSDPLLMNFMSRQSNVSILYTNLLIMARTIDTNEATQIALAMALRNDTMHLNITYPADGTVEFFFAEYFRTVRDFEVALQRVRGAAQISTDQVTRSRSDLQEAYALSQSLAQQVEVVRSTYQSLVNLTDLVESMRADNSASSQRLREQARRLNATASDALSTAMSAVEVQRQAQDEAGSTELKLTAINTTVQAVDVTLPDADAASLAADNAWNAAEAAEQNTSQAFPLPSTDLYEAQSIAADTTATNLTQQTQAAEVFYQYTENTVEEHNDTIASLVPHASDAGVLGAKLRDDSRNALASAQAAHAAANSAIAKARQDLTILSNFSDESAIAKSLADDALEKARAVVSTANTTLQEAELILSQHSSASVNAGEAARASTSATRSITDSNKVAMQQQLRVVQLSTNVNSISRSADRLNASIANKTAEADVQQQQCAHARALASTTSSDVTRVSPQVTLATKMAADAQHSALALQAEFESIGDLPSSRLEALGSELSRLQTSLTQAQVSQMITSLQAALDTKETMQTMLEHSLATIGAEVRRLGTQRDALVDSCHPGP
eukprot:scpid2548/ scgid25039/ Laminin subunit beta-2; Laminin chain B3; Laminin-11 subunit beta; Laminin-14 subunit beta; Laminin-15 subunit beta; Laminin-3 subunit beta; Laminin-4 subunit beta; Laminin-7 subunit beta; Laminin-9 subunit beta; S-laminin subunit beta